MIKKIGLTLLISAFTFQVFAYNGENKASKILNSDGFECPEGLHPDERGWWWGCTEPEESISKPPKMTSGQTKPTKEQKEELCSEQETWDAKECGFVNPNKIKDYKKAFEFQKMQQEQLSRQMVMNPTDEKAVLEYQKYNKWWLKQSVLTSDTWKFNILQNPEMDPKLKNPISTYGLQMASQIRKLDKESVWETLKEDGAFFVWWTSSDCQYCHAQAKTMKRLPKRMGGLEIYNTSLDDKCIEGYKGEFCRTVDEEVNTVAALLKIEVVPTLMMFIPNDVDEQMGGTWLKIAHGITSANEIENRSYKYFKAHASAIKKGLTSAIAGTPAMDFDYKKPTGVVSVDLSADKEDGKSSPLNENK